MVALMLCISSLDFFYCLVCDVLFFFFVIVMAAELVRAARSENDGELERLRLGSFGKLQNFQKMKPVKLHTFHF